MNQGYLKMIVLQLLSEKPLSGYSIVKSIKELTGWKPSYGSIYPLLEKLEKEKVIQLKEEGRSKIYALTSLGKERFAQERELQHQAIGGIIEQLKLLACIGDEEAAAMAQVLEAHRNDGVPFLEVPEIIEMRGELFRLQREGKIKTQAEKIRKIVTRTTKELRQIK